MNLPHPVPVFSVFGLLPADLCLLFATAPLTACAFAGSAEPPSLLLSLPPYRRQSFQCAAPPPWVSWCWLRLTKSHSCFSQKTPGFPPRLKWRPQRETSTTFPSTAGSVAARCTYSEREQVFETGLRLFHHIQLSHACQRLIVIFFLPYQLWESLMMITTSVNTAERRNWSRERHCTGGMANRIE